MASSAASMDVAGSIFTSAHRHIKIAGKEPPPMDLNGTGSVRRSPAALPGHHSDASLAALRVMIIMPRHAARQAASCLVGLKRSLGNQQLRLPSSHMPHPAAPTAGCAPYNPQYPQCCMLLLLLQCFDATALSPKRAGGHQLLQAKPQELPRWSKAACAYE